MQTTYPISQTLSKRLQVLKLVLMVMIVYQHSYNLAGTNFEYGTYFIAMPPWMETVQILFSRTIAELAVPGLFLVSGFLLFAKPFTFWGNTRRKAKTILLPFLFWNSMWVLFFLIAQHIPFSAPYFGNEERYVSAFSLLDWLNAYFPLNSSGVFAAPLWFLSDLFRLNLIALLLKKAIDFCPTFTLALLGFLWAGNIPVPFIRAEALLFFCLGYYIVKYRLSVQSVDRLKWWDLLPVYIGGIAAEFLLPGFAPLLRKVNIVVGIVVALKLSALLVGSSRFARALTWASQYSFIIYVVHEYTLSIFKKFSVIYLPRVAVTQFIMYWFLPLFVMGLCILFGMAFSRLFPRFYKWVTGGR